ncbi:uncharacterized protein LOC121854487 isoform X3 [Homarus americanus]|nr:uncharacterized protein LOC121854487 isoform X3 [Homarus americanus]
MEESIDSDCDEVVAVYERKGSLPKDNRKNKNNLFDMHPKSIKEQVKSDLDRQPSTSAASEYVDGQGSTSSQPNVSMKRKSNDKANNQKPRKRNKKMEKEMEIKELREKIHHKNIHKQKQQGIILGIRKNDRNWRTKLDNRVKNIEEHMLCSGKCSRSTETNSNDQYFNKRTHSTVNTIPPAKENMASGSGSALTTPIVTVPIQTTHNQSPVRSATEGKREEERAKKEKERLRSQLNRKNEKEAIKDLDKTIRELEEEDRKLDVDIGHFEGIVEGLRERDLTFNDILAGRIDTLEIFVLAISPDSQTVE